MRHGFVVGTPLHIINMLNIQANFLEGQEIVFFMYNDFEKSEELSLAIKKYFPHIEIVLVDLNQMGSKIRKISRLYTNENPFFDGDIDEIYAPSDTYFVRILYANQYKKNKKVGLNYVEDGIGSYIHPAVINTRNFNDIIQSKFNKNSIFNGYWNKSFLYEPDLVNTQLGQKTLKIPKLNLDNKIYNLLMKLFKEVYVNLNTQRISETKILFFDQPFGHDRIAVDDMSIFKELKEVSNYLNIPLQVKMHPRSNVSKYYNYHIDFLETSLPWEIYILFNDISNYILVGINTTASLSPYLMFGKEIPVILLIKVVSKYYTDHTDNFSSESVRNSSAFFEKNRFCFRKSYTITCK